MPVRRPTGAAARSGLRMGPRGSLQPRIFVKNTAAVVANFFAADQRAQRAIRRTVRDYAGMTADLTRFFAPRDSGFLADHVAQWFTPRGFEFEVGWDPDTFAQAGLPYYPPFVEFGTERNAAQPSLGPAYNEVAPQFRRALGENISAALARRTR